MAGFDTKPLSQISLKDQDRPFPYNTVPWTQDLTEQYGNSILCQPYMFTPFSLPNVMRKLDHVLWDRFEIEPALLKCLFVSTESPNINILRLVTT